MCWNQACSFSDLDGATFKLDYNFYQGGSDGDYAFGDSEAGMSFMAPSGGGEGVMKVKYCFNGDNSNDMVAVQTGFQSGDIIPIKIVKYEEEEVVEKIYNEYSFTGEYNCASGELMVGFTGYFDSNAFSLLGPAHEGASLDSDGCLVED